MFLKQVRQKSGRINISFVQGYRDPETKKTKHLVIENLGYVDEYEHLYDDPIAHFKEIARKRTLEMENKKAEKEIFLGTVYADEIMAENENSLKHMGFLPISSIYHQLNIHQFIINRQRSLKMHYSLNDVMQLLVYTRILSPEKIISPDPLIVSFTIFILLWIILQSLRRSSFFICMNKLILIINEKLMWYFMMLLIIILKLIGKMSFDVKDFVNIIHVIL